MAIDRDLLTKAMTKVAAIPLKRMGSTVSGALDRLFGTAGRRAVGMGTTGAIGYLGGKHVEQRIANSVPEKPGRDVPEDLIGQGRHDGSEVRQGDELFVPANPARAERGLQRLFSPQQRIEMQPGQEPIILTAPDVIARRRAVPVPDRSAAIAYFVGRGAAAGLTAGGLMAPSGHRTLGAGRGLLYGGGLGAGIGMGGTLGSEAASRLGLTHPGAASAADITGKVLGGVAMHTLLQKLLGKPRWEDDADAEKQPKKKPKPGAEPATKAARHQKQAGLPGATPKLPPAVGSLAGLTAGGLMAPSGHRTLGAGRGLLYGGGLGAGASGLKNFDITSGPGPIPGKPQISMQPKLQTHPKQHILDRVKSQVDAVGAAAPQLAAEGLRGQAMAATGASGPLAAATAKLPPLQQHPMSMKAGPTPRATLLSRILGN